MSKLCRLCNTIKPLSEFYKHKDMADGYLNQCKPCYKSRVRKTRANNVEYYREYDRERSKTPENRLRNALNSRAYELKHPERYKATTALNNAIQDKKLFRLPCEVCGNLKVEAHHPDYSKPLSVVWLCPEHHKAIHLLYDNIVLRNT